MSPERASSADSELLAVLERAFAHHAGTDDRIDVDDLRRALGMRSDYLVRRIFAGFDLDGDGYIAKEEFLSAVRALVFGTDREKLTFAFRLWDQDGDGLLDREELHRMIALSLAEGDVEERLNQPAEQLVSVLIAKADKNRDGRLSLDELVEVSGAYPDLVARMTRSEAIWIAPNEELLLLLDERSGRGHSPPQSGLSSRREQAMFLSVWIAANVAVFVWSMTQGRAAQTHDPAMQVGRALGACIDLNVAFVLLPMMRRMLSWLRSRWIGHVVPIDDAVAFHKIVGHSLFALAVTHSSAFVLAWTGGHVQASPWGLFATSRGLTGIVLLAVFFVMWIFSHGFVRRSQRFELFYFTHLLYLVWLVLVIAHAPRILVFSGFGIVAFVVEQLLRWRRRAPSARVLSVSALRSGVTRLEIERPIDFRFGAADYAFLRIPGVALREWHPFTISSAPEVPTLTFHIRSLGNWTAALRRRTEKAQEAPIVSAFVDGPYGSPSARIFQSRFAVLIGAGIGVTPFASVLESAVLRSNSGADAGPSALEKVHFFWLNRDQYSFEWFRGLLSRLEQEDARGLLEINLCMTGMRTGVTAFGLELSRELMHASGRSDFITGLRTRTHLGQPDWDTLLGAIASRHPRAEIDVYFCGPHGLARKLAPICSRLGMRFREELF